MCSTSPLPPRFGEIAPLPLLAPSTVRPLARDPRVLVGWPFPLGFGLDGRLLLAQRGRVYVSFIISPPALASF